MHYFVPAEGINGVKSNHPHQMALADLEEGVKVRMVNLGSAGALPQIGPVVAVEYVSSAGVQFSPTVGHRTHFSLADYGLISYTDGDHWNPYNFVIRDEDFAQVAVKLLEDLGVQPADLDDMVYMSTGEEDLEELNSEESEDGQEEVIAGSERTASSINNGGLESQVEYLVEGGATFEDLLVAAGKR